MKDETREAINTVVNLAIDSPESFRKHVGKMYVDGPTNRVSEDRVFNSLEEAMDSYREANPIDQVLEGKSSRATSLPQLTIRDFEALPEGTKLYLERGYTDSHRDTFESGEYIKVGNRCVVQRLIDGKPVGDTVGVLKGDMHRFRIIK